MCWEGFKGRKWRDDVDVRDFIQIIIQYTMETKVSLQALQMLQISFGLSFQSFKRKRGPRAEFWIWRPKWFPPLHHTVRDI